MSAHQDSPLLIVALAYARLGWCIFPCHTPTATGCSCRRDTCTSGGKHPRTIHGVKDATTNETIIRRWWTMWPAANIGIATGAISNLVVLDVDSYAGGDDSLVELEHTYSPLPGSIQQLTGGGGHQYFFAHPGGYVKNSVKTLGAGLDIRADGGYAIVPPSLHRSGKHYEWELSSDPADTPLSPLPGWLLRLCQGTTRRETVHTPGESISEGQRNDTLFRVGCGLRARGVSEAAILAALAAINATQCQPALADDEVARLATSCARYEPGATATPRHAHRQLTDYIDPWLGRRSEWCGVPLGVRRIP